MTEIITALGAIIGVLAVAVKLLLNDWFKKSEDLEDLKKKNANQIQNRLEDELKILRSIVTTIQSTIRALTAKLDRSDIRIDGLMQQMTSLAKSMEDYHNSTSDKIKNMIKSEVVDLTKNLALIRAKKNEP